MSTSTRYLFATFFATFAFSSATAQAATQLHDLNNKPAVSSYQKWVDESLVPTPSVNIDISDRGCPFAGFENTWGCARRGNGINEIYFSLSAPIYEQKKSVYHEMGHVASDQLTVEEKQEFADILGVDYPWRDASSSTPLSEQWAVAYSIAASLSETQYRQWLVDQDLVKTRTTASTKQRRIRTTCTKHVRRHKKRRTIKYRCTKTRSVTVSNRVADFDAQPYPTEYGYSATPAQQEAVRALIFRTIQ